MREMKDSGIEWVGKIPKDWEVHPVYVYFEEGKTKNYRMQEQNLLSLSYGRIIRKDINTNGGLLPASFNTYNVVEAGDIIIRPTDLQNDKRSLRTGLVKEQGIITSAYIDLRPKDNVNSKYYHYLLHSYDIIKVFYNMGNGVRQGLNFSEFAKLLLLEPTTVEQQQIADFLDTKCFEIDATAEDIQKEISLLEDYKKSVINEAVTKGLNPDAEMKDSGIEWIGEIPKDWDLLKIGYVTKEISDIDHYMPSDSDDIDKVPYLMIGDLKENISQIDFESCKYISKKVYRALSIKSKPEKENVIFARYATIGTVCFVDSEKQLLVSYACLTVKANELIKGRFLFYYFKSNAFLEEVSQYVKSNTQGNIGKESLIRAKIVVPKLKEQIQIISYLDTKCSEIDTLIADKKRQLDILADYKKSLIYEYVTGKKEVPVNE